MIASTASSLPPAELVLLTAPIWPLLAAAVAVTVAPSEQASTLCRRVAPALAILFPCLLWGCAVGLLVWDGGPAQPVSGSSGAAAFPWEWLASRLTAAPLRMTWGIDPLALVWMPVVALIGGLRLCRDATVGARSSPREHIQPDHRAVGLAWQLLGWSSLLAAPLARDFASLWICTVLGSVALVAAARQTSSDAAAWRAISRMQFWGLVACGLFAFALVWLWREFRTLQMSELQGAVRLAIDDLPRRSTVQMIVWLLTGAALLLAGIFPTSVWISPVSRLSGYGMPVVTGRFALASVLILRAAPLGAEVLPPSGTVAGLAAFAALLLAGIAVATTTARSVLGLAGAAWALHAIAAASAGEATGWQAALQLIVTLLLALAVLSESLPPEGAPSDAPASQEPVPVPASRWASWGMVALLASGLWGPQQSLQAVWWAGRSAAVEAVGVEPAGVETARLIGSVTMGNFALTHGLLIFALVRLCGRPYDGRPVDISTAVGRSPRRWSHWCGAGTGPLLLLVAVLSPLWLGLAVPLRGQGLVSSAEPRAISPFPDDLIGLTGVCGLCGGLCGLLFRRLPSARQLEGGPRVESLARLFGRGLYLDEIYRIFERFGRSAVTLWRQVDAPDRDVRRDSPLAALGRVFAEELAPLSSTGGWFPTLLAIATAALLCALLATAPTG